MEGPTNTCPTPDPHQPLACLDEGQPTPFSQQWVTITKQEHIDLNWRANYWEAQHARVKAQMEALKQDNSLKDAKIKDLQNRLFGKKSENHSPLKSEKGSKADTSSKRNRGQQPGSRGHGRVPRPDLPVVHDEIDVADAEKCCSTCGLAYRLNPALDEHSEVIEVEYTYTFREIAHSANRRTANMTDMHRYAEDCGTEKKTKTPSQRPVSAPPSSRRKKSLSMHEGIAVWCDCCSCEAEPYWVEAAETMGINLGSDYEDVDS